MKVSKMEAIKGESLENVLEKKIQVQSKIFWIVGFVLLCTTGILGIVFIKDSIFFIGFSILLISIFPFYVVWGVIIWRTEEVKKAELQTDKHGFALCEPCGLYHPESNMTYQEDTNSWICKGCMRGVV